MGKFENGRIEKLKNENRRYLFFYCKQSLNKSRVLKLIDNSSLMGGGLWASIVYRFTKY